MTPASQERAKKEFLAKFGFSGVLGAVDCTHLQLRATSENALIHENHKGTHSTNIQVNCGTTCKVTLVLSNYLGSSHDFFIQANSGGLLFTFSMYFCF